jgi:hypothetical protein
VGFWLNQSEWVPGHVLSPSERAEHWEDRVDVTFFAGPEITNPWRNSPWKFPRSWISLVNGDELYEVENGLIEDPDTSKVVFLGKDLDESDLIQGLSNFISNSNFQVSLALKLHFDEAAFAYHGEGLRDIASAFWLVIDGLSATQLQLIDQDLLESDQTYRQIVDFLKSPLELRYRRTLSDVVADYDFSKLQGSTPA